MKKVYWLGSFILIIGIVLWMYTMHVYPKHNDDYYMEIALQLAKNNPKAPFAAIIVDNKTGDILSEGLAAVSINPTFHGEMVAINNAIKKHPQINWANTTLYTTAEPCSMCQSAIIWSGISRVVFATSLDYLKAHGWHSIDINAAEVNSRASFYKGTLTGGILANKTNVLFNK